VAIEVIVILAPSAVDADSAARRSIDACAARLGVSLAPMHPFATDHSVGGLGTYFMARVDTAALDTVVERLLSCDGVEGAYPKEPGAPPERM
jgi:hypothetical protein